MTPPWACAGTPVERRPGMRARGSPVLAAAQHSLLHAQAANSSAVGVENDAEGSHLSGSGQNDEEYWMDLPDGLTRALSCTSM